MAAEKLTRPPKQEQLPAETAVSEVGPNVLRMQLPIAMPGLGHVNAYAFVDERGVAVLDAGLPGPGTWRTLVARLKSAGLRVRDVHTVLVTHSHPDHFGCAGRLASEARADLVTHTSFRLFWGPGQDPCDNVDHDHSDDNDQGLDAEDLPTGNAWLEPPPWGGERSRPPLSRRLMYKAMRSRVLGNYRLPPAARHVRHGDVVRLAGRDLFVVHTPGHTLDHVCLHDPEAGLVFTGDHLLPTITPHISGIAAGRDPLRNFFASLDRVAELDDVRTALPAHGHPFDDVPGRAAAIRIHHEGRLDKLGEISTALGPTTVREYSHQLFRPARWGAMAESETYAHLEHLRLAGRAERHDEGGIPVYRVPS
ncbi:MAG TPA: MBL fold metallo-hydrolase [Acidimicrobiales bacterium]|nr:MBL fold metallo-hydrolase [Acidimicrobiales bacterium]